MPLRFRTGVFIAFGFLFLYLISPFSRSSRSFGGARVVDALKESQDDHGGDTDAGFVGKPAPSPTLTSTTEAILVISSTLLTAPGATSGPVTDSLQLQEQFEKEYEALGA